jgi:hypothetical protein
MEIKRVKYFSISTEDKPGELSRFANRMKEANVDMAGVWGFAKGQGKAEIIVVPKDPDKFKKAALAAGWTTKEGSCFHLTGEDRVGALSDTLDRVAQEGINLHAVDALSLGGKYTAYVWTDEKDVERLAKVLKT